MTMTESMFGGEFLCKNINETWTSLEDLSDNTYEREIIAKCLVLHLRFLLIKRENYQMTLLFRSI